MTRNVREEHLDEIFSRFGRVRRVVLERDQRVQLSKGEGTVEFERADDADEAQLCMDGVSRIHHSARAWLCGDELRRMFFRAAFALGA